LAGSMEEPATAEAAEVPCSPYAAAKWAANGYARMFHALYGIPTVTLRIFMVYGQGHQDTNKFIPYVTQALLRGETPAVSSGCRAVDWVFVEDVVDAFIRVAGDAGRWGGATFDIGTGILTTIRDVAEYLGELIDPSVKLQFGALQDRPLER